MSFYSLLNQWRNQTNNSTRATDTANLDNQISDLQAQYRSLLAQKAETQKSGGDASAIIAQMQTIQNQISSLYNQRSGLIDLSKYYNINQDDFEAFTWGWLNQTGVSLLKFTPLQGGYVYMPQYKAPFSPFNEQEITSLDNILLLFLVMKLSKDPRALAALAETYIKSQTVMVEAISKMGSQSWFHSANATMLLAAFLHSRGLINNAGIIRVQEHARTSFDKMFLSDVALGALNGVTTLIDNSSLTTGKGSTSTSGLPALALLAKGAAP